MIDIKKDLKNHSTEKLESLLKKSFLANTLAKKEKREEILKLQLKLKKELDKRKKENGS